ncbi:AAA family ATPase [Acinetobacter baumannii]
MIRLNKITVKNFKIFNEEPFTVNFNNNSLILLDGPNGYGKTSIFDAIELALTGNISRLIPLENRQIPSDIVVAHKNAKDVEITIEFIDNHDQIRTFKRKLKNQRSNNTSKISNFTELWDFYEVKDNNNIIVTKDNILEEYFQSKNFSRDFLLFHYVQQEETSHFLKSNNETQRAAELAQLFGNTTDASLKLNNLNNIYKKINDEKKRIAKEIESTKAQYNIDNLSDLSTNSAPSHSYIFPWLTNSNIVFWDAPTINDLNQEKLNLIISDLKLVQKFIEHKDFFFRIRSFTQVTLQKEMLKIYLGYFHFIDNIDKYESNNRLYNIISNSYKILKSAKLEEIKTLSEIDILLEKFIPDNIDLFKNELNNLIEEQSKVNGLNSIYSEIIKYHDILNIELQKIPDEDTCLLCGSNYSNHDDLLHAIVNHGHLLRSELSEKEKIYIESRDRFFFLFLQPLINYCEEYLELHSAPSLEDLNNIQNALLNKDRLSKLKDWLLSQNISHDDLIAKSFPLENKDFYFSYSIDEICKRILAAIGEIPESYFINNTSNSFERIYTDYFSNKIENIENINATSIAEKEIYIRHLYFNSIQNISNKILKLNAIHSQYESSLNDLDKLIKKIKKKISEYQKKLITDIEIPFYIYSGKILQFHQAGLGQGVFVKDPTGNNELKNLKVVSNWQTDHDVLNTMSSGQISAVVIALTLALHRVYSKKLSCILIDDPVQTMDDINMSSLVELLRNDFKDKQVILSTHEDKVSRYFTYKYLKHKKNVRVVNVMQRKEFSPTKNITIK